MSGMIQHLVNHLPGMPRHHQLSTPYRSTNTYAMHLLVCPQQRGMGNLQAGPVPLFATWAQPAPAAGFLTAPPGLPTALTAAVAAPHPHPLRPPCRH